MNTYSLVLENEPLFWLGDRFYKVGPAAPNYSSTHRNSYEEFSSKCPSCNGERKITYKGYNGDEFECECPICKGSISHGYGDKIRITNWEVQEYIVYKIEAAGPENVSAYKDGKGHIGSWSLTAFHKFGRCMDDFITTHVPSYANRSVDRDVETIGMDKDYFNPSDYVFRKKADATKFCEALKERDRQKLAEFNKTYGTDYEYPY